MFGFFVNLFLLALTLLPFSIASMPLVFSDSFVTTVIASLAFPIIFIASYLAICISAATLSKKAIIPGRFPRDPNHHVYGLRRLFGISWTAIYYNKPLYWLILSNNTLKKMVFRGFGYQGSLDFTTYADTWLRDLPLVKLGAGAYLANRATIGTNLVMSNGEIAVNSVEIGEKSVIGHLCIVGIGTKIGNGTELGLSSATGMRVIIGNNVHIGPRCDLNHGCVIGDGVRIGASSYIGSKAKIEGKGIEIPPRSSIPMGAIIKSQEDLVKILGYESTQLNIPHTPHVLKNKSENMINTHLQHH